jgi:hypothetical protein
MAKNKNQAKSGRFVLLALLSLIILASFASAQVITGFRQVRFDGVMSLNSTNLDLMTANTSRIYITQSGLIGIGTTSPSHTLTIIGDLNVTGTSYIGQVIIDAENVTTNKIRSKGGNISFFNDTGDELVRILSTGEVGIGTTQPESKLKVVGNLNVTGTIFGLGTNNLSIGDGGWTDDGSEIRLTTSTDLVGIGTDSPTEKLQVSGNGSFTGDLVVSGDLLGSKTSTGSGVLSSIGWADDGSVIRLATSTDKVGIGTTVPGAKLHISENSDTSENWLIINDTDTTTGSIIPTIEFHGSSGRLGQLRVSDANGFEFRNGSQSVNVVIGHNGKVGIGTAAPNSQLEVNATNNGIGILTNGSVGIGTTTPDQLLHVYDGGYGAYLKVEGTGDDYNFAGLELASDEGTDKHWAILHRKESGDINKLMIEEFDGATYSKRMVVSPGGNVGIGTTNPGSTLDVSGTVNLSTGTDWLNFEGGDSSTRFFPRFVGKRTISDMTELMDIVFSSSSLPTTGLASIDVYADGTGAGRDSKLEITVRDDGTARSLSIDGNASGGQLTWPGKVGIGTTSPGYPLEIDTSDTGYTLYVNGTSGGSTQDAIIGIDAGDEPKLVLLNAGNTSWQIMSEASDHSLRIGNDTGESAIKMTILQNGNVGIGTTGPGRHLDISGNPGAGASEGIRINHTGNTDGGSWFLAELCPAAGCISPGAFVIQQDGGTSSGVKFVVLNNSGRVGIGTVTPSSSLQVSGTNDDTAQTGVNLGMSGNYASMELGGSDGGFIDFSEGDNSVDHAGRILYAHSINAMQFVTSATEQMRIDSSGNVGIGTDSPSQKLDVVGNIEINNTTPRLFIVESDQAADEKIWDIVVSGSTIEFKTQNDNLDSSDNYMAVTRSGVTVQTVSFYTNNDNERMRIDVNGNVGIGTTAPTEKLVVAGNANITGILYKGISEYSNPDIAETMKPYGGVNFESGSVVCVSEKDPEGFDNYVEICRGKYNSSVVGIVSVNATMIIGSKGEMPVALMGRVFVKVTNESGPISKGDLLTTSSAPGNAMKFNLIEFETGESDYQRVWKMNENEKRRNSILGKALESIDQDEGKILALVTLQ